MSSAAYLAKNFELRKGGKECNLHNCPKMPSKEIVLIETDVIKSRTREIGTLYMCSDHYADIDKITSDIQKLSVGKLIDKKVFEIGFVTY